MKQGRVFLLGVGHRARQGKDTVAGFISDMRKNVYTLHFVDALYKEVRNKERKYPLVIQCGTNASPGSGKYYMLLDNAEEGRYLCFRPENVMYLHQLFVQRGIAEYMGMNEKDAPMLQFWGTDFRRAQDPDYWVKRTNEQVQWLRENFREVPADIYIVVSDTRFKNEVAYIKNNGGYYIRVVRLSAAAKPYVDPSRDPNHPSEIDIKDEEPYCTLVALSGDLPTLKSSTATLLKRLEEN